MHTALHSPVIWIISPVQHGVCAMCYVLCSQCHVPIRQRIKIAYLAFLAQFLINSNSFATRRVPHYEYCLYVDCYRVIRLNENSNHLASINNNKLRGQMNELLLPVIVWQCVWQKDEEKKQKSNLPTQIQIHKADRDTDTEGKEKL